MATDPKERCRCVEVPAFDTYFELSYYTGDDISITDPFLYGYALYVELRTKLLAFKNNGFGYGAANLDLYFAELNSTLYQISRQNALKFKNIGRALIEVDGNSFIGTDSRDVLYSSGTTRLISPLTVYVVNKIISETKDMPLRALLIDRYCPMKKLIGSESEMEL